MIQYETLYKVDTAGRVRVWSMEADGARTRTITGIEDGKQVVSGWKETRAKNVGRSNATTAEEQAIVEIENAYALKLEGDYHKSKTAAKRGKPQKVKAMLAAKWEDLKDKIEYPVAVQPKLDGVRAIVKKDGIWSRQGKRFLSVPHIEEQLAPLFKKYPDMILDGELYNHDLRDDFNQIISLVRKTKPTDEDLEQSEETVEFHVYDFGHYPELGFFERARALEQFVSTNQKKLPSIVFVETLYAENEEEVDELYGSHIEQGFEGGMIRLDTPYEGKRSKGLMKRKDFSDAEFEIVDVMEGQGNWAGYAKHLTIKLPDGTTQNTGMAGTQEYLKQVLAEREEYIGGEATVHYFNETPDGKLRFPVSKALFKTGRDC